MSRRSAADRRAAARADAGSAIVDFVLVGALTTFLFAGVLQLTLALHVRATLIDCAAEGARYGALADRTPEDGARRTRELVALSLAPGVAQDVVAEATTVDGLPVVRVEVSAALPVLGPLGPAGALVVDGHALEEAP
ncbi:MULTISPECIES: TadE/TadG family type IV pilus assembly protein [unclassified Actinotalea]|uniref:TadE/TadG family type IV pilus assembly protein n=1 Tax=unclassified Actinotalea TaxID=2638618 RepID=UPI0015F6A9F0|nr:MULTISPECIES: TadE/TadG family type IV pilus assembly protein [unclassified Actinotalea]